MWGELASRKRLFNPPSQFFVDGVICRVGLCCSYRCGFTYWGLLKADLVNVKQLIVKDLHMTLCSAQNPKSLSL